MKRARGLLAIALAGGVLAGCAVGPKYDRPSVQAPMAWRTEPTPPWQVASPRDAFPKGEWWAIFEDKTLNDYERQLLSANESLFAAKDRLAQARAAARISAAAYFPQLSTDLSAARERFSGNRLLMTAQPSQVVPDTENLFNIPFALTYEVDLFGRVRKNLEAANASLQSTAADLQNVQLVLTAELAADYFSLRELDAEAEVVTESVAIQQKGLDLVENRHKGGVASGLEAAQQASLLDATKAQLSLVQQQRDQFEHAIAVLTGNLASTFRVPVAALSSMPPAVPEAVPSEVLERRPDVASAERTMAYQNTQVGIATTAFYPRITLSSFTGGLQSRDLSTLVSAPSAVWSIGADLLQPVFNGGRNRANLEFAKAGYDASVANYRQTVLAAFQQVEDALSGLDTLATAAATQHAAVEDSRRALTIANNRYVGGVTTYLDVITAQAALLSNQRLATQLLGQQMVTSVLLVKALGGGWDASQLRLEQVRPQANQALQP